VRPAGTRDSTGWPFGKPTGDNTMVTKQDESRIFRELVALATLEALGGAIALGFVFNLLT